MANFKLTRIKKDINNLSFKAPDYEGFAKGLNGYIYMVGWLDNLSSDLSIKVTKVNDEWLSNKYNSRKFNEYLGLNQNNNIFKK